MKNTITYVFSIQAAKKTHAAFENSKMLKKLRNEGYPCELMDPITFEDEIFKEVEEQKSKESGTARNSRQAQWRMNAPTTKKKTLAILDSLQF